VFPVLLAGSSMHMHAAVSEFPVIDV